MTAQEANDKAIEAAEAGDHVAAQAWATIAANLITLNDPRKVRDMALAARRAGREV